MVTCCACVCVCVTAFLDRKRLRSGLGIRCVSRRTVIKKHKTQSTKSCGTSQRPSKRGELAHLCTVQICRVGSPSVALCHRSVSPAVALLGGDYGSFAKDILRSGEGRLLWDGKQHYNHNVYEIG